MKFSFLSLSTACVLAAASACSPSSGTPTPGSGGMTSSGSGGMTTSGSGGASTGSGGEGTGGAASGGTTGSGGAASGGATGTGGGTGTGGAASGGATGSGGAATGGATGSGGRGGGTGTGGTAPGTGGGTAGAPGDLISTVAGAWDGSLMTYPCQDRRSGYDCTNVGCTGGTKTTTKVYTIGGNAGTVYNVTFRVRGVVEAYAYVGGTRVSGTDSVAKGTSLFCSGGTQQPTTNGGDYNTYELDVAPPVTGETNVYYLNSVISSENPHTSNVTQHLTFPIDYSATIKVTGGGMVTFKSYDSNCALVQNCGPTQGNMCQAPRTISLAGAMPAAPTTFMQPYQMPTGSYGQWVFFDITNVVAQ